MLYCALPRFCCTAGQSLQRPSMSPDNRLHRGAVPAISVLLFSFLSHSPNFAVLYLDFPRRQQRLFFKVINKPLGPLAGFEATCFSFSFILFFWLFLLLSLFKIKCTFCLQLHPSAEHFTVLAK